MRCVMKNQSRLLWVLLLLMVLISLSAALLEGRGAVMAASPDRTREEIRQQLAGVKGTLVETRISGWIRVSENKIPLPFMLEKVRELLPLPGEDVQAQIQMDERQGVYQVKICVCEEDADYTILFYNSPQSGKKPDSGETYLIVDAVLKSDSAAREGKAYEKVEEILSQYEGSPSIGTTYTATISGKLKEEEMEQTAKMLFSGLNADITECNRDTGWISLTGYSSLIGGGLESVNGRFNLNIALRCHSHEDKTYICLGTPVISIPY